MREEEKEEEEVRRRGGERERRGREERDWRTEEKSTILQKTTEEPGMLSYSYSPCTQEIIGLTEPESSRSVLVTNRE